MCGIIATWWLGRHNNGPIEERTNVGVRGSATNTRVVKLLPLKKDKGSVNDSERSGNQGSDLDVKGELRALPTQNDERMEIP
jgi:hypothetical protein